jgi:hypothetical protein
MKVDLIRSSLYAKSSGGDLCLNKERFRLTFTDDILSLRRLAVLVTEDSLGVGWDTVGHHVQALATGAIMSNE